jgi:four helix bundle protein
MAYFPMENAASNAMTPAMLEDRLVNFAVRIIPLANRLSTTFAGKHVAGQILRSGTSAAPNYAEARSAESRADFIHKLRIAVKELNETAIWLRIVAQGGLLKPQLLAQLTTECEELKRILGASLRTARLRGAKSKMRDNP